MFSCFDSQDAIELNKARLSHLESLGLDLNNRTVLEVGSGIGHLTGFFEDRGCHVVSTEGRIENVREHRRRFPYRDIRVFNLDSPEEYLKFSRCEVVFCYGTLYHLANPRLCLEGLSKLCSNLFLLETMVAPEDDSIVRSEVDPAFANQSMSGRACRPGREWIWLILKQCYEYTYLTRTQPAHNQFPTTWPNNNFISRSVFVASSRPLDLPALSGVLLLKQETCSDIIAQ